MNNEKFHVGVINSSFGIQIAGADVCFKEGEVVYILAEIYDKENPECTMWYVVLKPLSKDSLRINSEFVDLMFLENVPRFPH